MGQSVSIYLLEETIQQLSKLAEAASRSLSAEVAYLVTKAYQESQDNHD